MSAKRLILLFGFTLAVLVSLSVGAAFSAANSIPASRAEDYNEVIAVNSLKPTECASLNLTSKIAHPASANGSANLVLGTTGADTISSLGGTDCIVGRGENDTLQGGAGVDILLGGTGNDTLFGNGGNDALYGGEGDDSLYGGNQRDHLDGGPGYDVCDGENGVDTFANCEVMIQ